MGRNKKKKQKMHTPTPHRTRCTALVVLDSSRIRRRALKQCQIARTTFEKAESELALYDKKDIPYFKRWYHSELRQEIGELRSTIDQANALRQRMSRLARFASLKRCNLRDAARMYEQSASEFERIERKLEERAQREAEEARRQMEEEREHILNTLLVQLERFILLQKRQIRAYLKRGNDPFSILQGMMYFYENEHGVPVEASMQALMEPRGQKILRSVGLGAALDDDESNDEFDDFEAFVNDLFGEEFEEDETDREDQKDKGKSTSDEARITALRRELAFALHPDQSDSGSDPAKLELWYQVQEAVEARDLDRLEVLHAHMQVLCGELSPWTPVSRLQSLTDMYRRSRDALRRRIRSLRKTPEWGFSETDEARREKIKKACAAKLAQEISDAKIRLKMVYNSYQQEFAPRQKKPSRPNSPPPPQPDYDPEQLSFF